MKHKPMYQISRPIEHYIQFNEINLYMLHFNCGNEKDKYFMYIFS